jgi:glycosyltransferase involved in cell wall biosynthesis
MIEAMGHNTGCPMSPRIAYIVTEDWYFLSHRLPMARAAKAAGFTVHVLCRISDGRAAIEREGFIVHPLGWSRGSVSPVASIRDVAEIAGILRRIDPAIVHNIAMKPALLGSLAALRLPQAAVVTSITGLGSAFLGKSLAGRAAKAALGRTVAGLLSRRRARTIVQNPDDAALLASLGVRPANILLIPGSGVDTDLIRPTPEPPLPVRAAFVGRMLEDKGVRTLVAAHRLLRGQGVALELLLAGEPDPENPTSIPLAELQAWGREPGITWAGHVSDIGALWRNAHIAVLPSRREGLPKSLLEAAAAGRPMVATDAPGCRDVAIDGETGLLAPVDDAPALAAALARLATDPALRQRFGANARRMAETRFSSSAIGAATAELYRSLVPA